MSDHGLHPAFLCRVPELVDAGTSAVISSSATGANLTASLNRIMFNGSEHLGDYPLTKTEKGTKTIYVDTATGGKDFKLVVRGHMSISSSKINAVLTADTKAGKISEKVGCGLLLQAHAPH